MTLDELGTILGEEIRFERQGDEYCASFPCVEFRGGLSNHPEALTCVVGRGRSRTLAMENLADGIGGLWLVQNANRPDRRREFRVPKAVTYVAP